GIALALQAHRAGRAVTLWARHPARVGERLPGIVLPPGIAVTGTLPHADFVLLAVPLQQMREVATALPPGGPLICCAKGIEAGSLALPLEILAEAQPGRPAAMLTGPSFAREVAMGLPTAVVLAAESETLRAGAIAALATPPFRLYGNDDPVGAQVGGAAKNVVAIAAGAVIGAGLGENARAALITRGLAELARLAVALGGRAETVSGLSGLGDLLLTCTSEASRNYSFGLALGRGAQPADILAARTAVTEGVATAPALVARALRLGVAIPVCAAVAGVLGGRITLDQAIAALLARPLREE
ncbi:MAG TPA: NAD(P)H-dependent glycerol-3-phosphate dehydrogenase, partial [Acetobacteraceae bacterium]|nr:NAD(P)H-dependent glycerol-3-phosphate dehydrogenase [Acetobacteraceae bacterium]